MWKLDRPAGIVLTECATICMCFVGTNTNLICSFIIELCVLNFICTVRLRLEV